MKTRTILLLLSGILLLIGLSPLDAQVMRLRQKGSNSNRVSVGVGEQVDIEVYADLQGVESAGISFYISVPLDAFQVMDKGLPGQVGVQPFEPGPLFTGATPGPNLLLPETDPAAQTFEGQQLEYSMVLGSGSNRVRTGAGVVAYFSLVCVKPIDGGAITIDDNAVRETRLVLSDGISERRFRTVQGMEISVSGIKLRDIPDVVLAPGQVDSLTIGSLNSYVTLASVPVDSLRWAYAPLDFDSLDVYIDPVTKRVTITPAEGWIGRRTVTWTATEPVARVPGLPPLSTSELSTVIVNNPPQFTMEKGEDGVKRDTVRFREDEYPFLATGEILNPVRALRWIDLDDIVFDPDIVNPQTELSFASLTYGQATLSPVRGQVDPETHQMLIWSRAQYSGIDSLKVVVRDGLRGGEDSLRVILVIEGENDPPRFTLEDRNPKISRGGSKTYLLEEIVEDPDTELDSLVFSWVDDPGEHFSVDTLHTEAGVEITVKGVLDFSGDGRVTFRIEDPLDPATQVDQILLFFEASESLPPDVFPGDIKIDLIPEEKTFAEILDDFVNDPDNSADELAWLLPPKTYKSIIGIDENRELTVSAPIEFVGYEEVTLTVTDPQNQSDFLLLRIYSSLGDPSIGGIPDLIMDRGETNQEIDLDNYYFDADNLDEEMFWEALRTFDTTNLQVQIDPITHVVQFFVPESAAFKTETVVFRVTDPAGVSAADTMLVTIRSGGDQGGGAGFRILPLPADMQVPVERFSDVLDLDEYVDPPDTSIQWTVALLAGENSVPRVIEGNVLSIYGLQSGLDTLQFTARDTLGRTQTATATVRVFGESEILGLLSIPDIQFISGQSATTDTLHLYIEDRETHPDSVVKWRVEALGPQENIFVRINKDQTLFATAPDTGTVQIVLVAQDTALGVVGRDTIRVISLDPSLGSRTLKDFPPVVFVSGTEDSSIVLDDFLPDEFLTGDGPAPKVKWTVSGQRITQPIISTQVPHLLKLRGVGAQIGSDTLTFVADIGGGFRAAGQMGVTVVEPIDESTLDLQIVPNPVNPFFMDLFVIARRELAGTPNVIRSFEASDSTVSVRQIEDALQDRGVLVWAGNMRVRLGGSGTVLFQAQAFTALGTDVKDTASVSIATSVAGKRLALAHRGARLELPADALASRSGVLMQVEGADEHAGAAKRAWGAGDGELEPLEYIDIYPAGRPLAGEGRLEMGGEGGAGTGIYRLSEGAWEYLGEVGEQIAISELGRFGLLRDRVPPRIDPLVLPGQVAELVAEVRDGGSGLDAESILLALDGEEAEWHFDGGVIRWVAPVGMPEGNHLLALKLRDRAGNESVREISFNGGGQPLPRETRLGSNFPNPFNPGTTIPFTLAPVLEGKEGIVRVRLTVYNIAGQMVRRLLDEGMAPGVYQVPWDGRDDVGRGVSSGAYIYRLETPGMVISRRMTLLK